MNQTETVQPTVKLSVNSIMEVEIPNRFPQYRKIILFDNEPHSIFKINSLDKTDGMYSQDILCITTGYGSKTFQEDCILNAYRKDTIEATEEEWNEALNKHIEYCHSLKNPIN